MTEDQTKIIITKLNTAHTRGFTFRHPRYWTTDRRRNTASPTAQTTFHFPISDYTAEH